MTTSLREAMETEDRLAMLGAQLRQVQAGLTELTTAEVSIKSEITELLDGQVGTIVVHDVPLFSVSYARRFNEDLARRVLPQPVLDQISVTVLSSAAAKRALPPDLYERCQKFSDNPTIKLKA